MKDLAKDIFNAATAMNRALSAQCPICDNTGEFYDIESGDGTGADMKKPCKRCRKEDYQEFQKRLKS